MSGDPCPICGATDPPGEGPCSAECEAEMYRREDARARRDDWFEEALRDALRADDDWRGDDDQAVDECHQDARL